MYSPETELQPASPGVPVPPPKRSTLSPWLLALILGLVTVALFWPATRCGFVDIDDTEYVVENAHIHAGLNWGVVKWAFGNTELGGYWAPLMWLSHALGCQLFDLKPWGHHLINVLLHAASAALVFLVFYRMTGAKWRSFFLAALFAWHPLRAPRDTF